MIYPVGDPKKGHLIVVVLSYLALMPVANASLSGSGRRQARPLGFYNHSTIEIGSPNLRARVSPAPDHLEIGVIKAIMPAYLRNCVCCRNLLDKIP